MTVANDRGRGFSRVPGLFFVTGNPPPLAPLSRENRREGSSIL